MKRLTNSLKKITKGLLISLGVFMLLFLGLELVWRYQWVDFYRKELKALNPPSESNSDQKKSNILLLGDSFTAQTESYVAFLRKDLPHLNLINSAIPGTGIREALAIAPGRVEKFQPKLVIYQVYVGNDLSDIRHPSGSALSWSRRTYWKIADRLGCIAWFNYASGQVIYQAREEKSVEKRAMENPESIPEDEQEDPKSNNPFSPETYNQREKILLEGEPSLLKNSIMLEGGRNLQHEILLEGIKKLAQICAENDTKLWIMVIPHCAQTAPHYIEAMRTLGADLPLDIELLAPGYPFFAQMKTALESNPETRQTGLFNLQPRFSKEETQGKQLYFLNDPHLNQWGQAVIADFLKPHLVSEFPFPPALLPPSLSEPGNNPPSQ